MKLFELAIPGFTIAGKEWGDPTKPSILALHGWLDNANSFEPLAEYLVKDFRVIAIDLPGHGHSSHLPLGCYYHFTDGIFTVVNIINALALDKVHLLGHSMGACLASLIAGVVPDRLFSLALIEGLGPFSSAADTACTQLATYANTLQKQTRKNKGYSQADAALARASKGYVSLDIAKHLCERGLIEDQGRFYWRHDPRLLTPSPLYLTEAQILSCLQNIKVKSCLIWASKGFRFDSKLMQERIHSVPDLKLIHLEGGHHIHMEEPGTLGKELLDFYQRLF